MLHEGPSKRHHATSHKKSLSRFWGHPEIYIALSVTGIYVADAMPFVREWAARLG